MYKLKVISVALFLSASVQAAPPLNFERDVLPALEKSCFKCHSGDAKKPKAGLRLDLAKDMEEFEELIVPGNPEKSSLYTLLALPKGHDDIMPPEGKAPEVDEKAKVKVKLWLEQGAHFGDWKKFVSNKEVKLVSGLADAKVETVLSKASAKIDTLVQRQLKKKKLKLNTPVDEETYLRRVYLNVVGRIPTLEETNSYLKSSSKTKREKLVQILQDSEGYVSHNFNYWGNILRAQSGQEGNSEGVWFDFLKDSLRDNTPYDQWVFKMLNASGAMWENPAIGFMRRDSRNRLAGYEALTGVFLGKQIGCAQCHDHPYDTTSRRDYFEMYGFIAMAHPYFPQNQILKNLKGREMTGEVAEVHSEMRLKKPRFGKQTRDIWLTAYLTLKQLRQRIVHSDNNHLSKFPTDYQYDDGKAGKQLVPDVMFGKSPTLEKGKPVAPLFAKWVASPDNLKFTYVIVNRLWHKIMGESVLGPLTDIQEVENAKNPELVQYLAELMVSLKYDMKAFNRILYNTRLYQSQAMTADEFKKHKVFMGPLLRRMTAEQAWDSLMTLIKPDLDADLKDKKPDFSFYHSVANAKSKEDFWTIVKKKALSDPHSKRRGKEAKMSAMMKKQGFSEEGFKRASELRQPAPAGHFLRQFGQADRELVEDQWVNPTVPQSLTLLNSKLIRSINGKDSALRESLSSTSEPSVKVKTLFASILTRYPSSAELQGTLSAIKSGSEYDYAQLSWVLLNTKQFLFIK
ncbi:MAG: PSD1 and planctomycete cytochrome C domain-containing protein [Lentisphaeraceae bacterium]|nr:PSD1 and planctomycete cytochrome C domain-containing protein [Lentisphaeraceae bacterium]